MDFEPAIKIFFKMFFQLWWVLALILLFKLFKSATVKGYLGELVINLKAKIFLGCTNFPECRYSRNL